MARAIESLKRAPLVVAGIAVVTIFGCVNGGGDASRPTPASPSPASIDQIRNVVVIYADRKSGV